jgi:Tfp pilus assembly protein PilO
VGDLEKIQKRFATLAAILGLAVLLLLVYLFWPGSSRSAQEEEKARLQRQLTSLSSEVELRKSSNPEKTRAELKAFTADLPVRYSEISQRLEKLSQQAGVTSASLKYSVEAPDKTDLPDVQRIKIDTSVTGDYGKVAQFINKMEQDRLFFIIEKIALSTKTEGGAVSLQISFDTFLKGAS